jgi:hypothetical protein
MNTVIAVPVSRTTFYCTSADHKPEQTEPSPGKKTRTTKKPSIRTGCTITISMIKINDGSVEVVYNWHHIGHVPHSTDDIKSSNVPLEVKTWIKEKLKDGLNWSAIKEVLCIEKDELTRVNTTSPSFLSNKLSLY